MVFARVTGKKATIKCVTIVLLLITWVRCLEERETDRLAYDRVLQEEWYFFFFSVLFCVRYSIYLI